MPVFRSAGEADFIFRAQDYQGDLRVVRFSGREVVSELFRFNLQLASEDGDIDFESVVGKPAILTIFGEEGERYINGLVFRFKQVGQKGRFTIYSAELVPFFWMISHRHTSRIFQNKSVPDIISQVFDEAGIISDQYRFALQNQYEPRESCVQYRESEFHFLSRLMEEEGIFYFFEHTDENHVMVISDNTSVHIPIAEPSTVIFHGTTGAVPSEEHIFRYHYAEEVRPGKVMLQDFDFQNPSLNLMADSQADINTELEFYDYPGEYSSPDKGAHLASLRLEELQVNRKRGKGKSVCRRFMPGYRFSLDLHARSLFNQEYLLTRVYHKAAQPQVLEEHAPDEETSYENDFECIPALIVFRPPRVTPRPLVNGVQTAIVVGPSGEEIYTDEYGRVKVQFHWDREGKNDENSSCWIRVGQAWAGSGWGAIFIPRIGQEVIVDFLEGDPDQPIITNCVYHGTNPPPYGLPDEKTKSSIKSNSSKGGGGFNEIRFEDMKDKEQVFFHAEKDQDVRVKNDAKEWIGKDRHLIVTGDQFEQVDGDKPLTAKGNQNEKVDGTISVESGMDIQKKAGMNYALDAGQEIHLKGGMNVIIEAGMQLTIKGSGGFVDIGPAGVTIQGNIVKINSGGAAGSGSGSSPEAPQLPLEADTAEPGKEPEPPKPKEYSPAAIVLKQAAKDGTPFCEKCEAAKKARKGQ